MSAATSDACALEDMLEPAEAAALRAMLPADAVRSVCELINAAFDERIDIDAARAPFLESFYHLWKAIQQLGYLNTDGLSAEELRELEEARAQARLAFDGFTSMLESLNGLKEDREHADAELHALPAMFAAQVKAVLS